MKTSSLTAIIIFVWFTISFASIKIEPFKIYIDADYSNHFESSFSIEQGLKVALQTTHSKLMGRPVEIIRKDHRGNSARSERHIKHYLKDPKAIAMISGIHSPPLLALKEYINKNNVLFLVPWAAAGPITRYPSENNSIFRLSVDDSKAGTVIVDFAVKNKHYKKPYLLLENTGWGKSNKKTMSAALNKHGVKDFHIKWFDWGLKETGAKALLLDAIKLKCDSIILVGNALEGQVICNTLATFNNEQRLPLLSHWGIIGGDFYKKVPHKNREKIDLHFIQTKFSFLNKNLNSFQQSVFVSAKKLYPEIQYKKDILAPTGFIHAYDLALLLIDASKNINPNLNITEIRSKVRIALENIEQPIQGLIKTYKKPFSKFSNLNMDAHEALGIEDFRMAKFGEKNEIKLVP